MNRGQSLLTWLVLIAGGTLAVMLYREYEARTPPAPTGAAIEGRARAVDGDSLEIGSARIRLFGIDAPEARQDCRDANGRDYACGAEARRALIDAIGSARVTCMPVGTSHDRVVARCEANGRDLSEAMVRSGHALELKNHSRGRYAAAEREAKNARRGLWQGSFERPAAWRREHPR